jgi:hypothetical protein
VPPEFPSNVPKPTSGVWPIMAVPGALLKVSRNTIVALHIDNGTAKMASSKISVRTRLIVVFLMNEMLRTIDF